MSSHLEGNRQAKRFPISQMVRYRPMNLEDHMNSYFIDPVETESTNASTGGLFISAGYPNEKNTPLEIRFHSIEESRELKLYGRVAWSSGDLEQSGMGVEILKLSKNEFKKFLNQAGKYWDL